MYIKGSVSYGEHETSVNADIKVCQIPDVLDMSVYLCWQQYTVVPATLL